MSEECTVADMLLFESLPEEVQRAALRAALSELEKRFEEQLEEMQQSYKEMKNYYNEAED